MSIINQLYCNKCRQPKSSAIRRFFLTQCGHIFCHQCATTGGSMCQRCQTPNIQTLELSEPLPPAIANLFTPCHEFLEKITMVANYKFGQITILNKLSQQLDEKYTLLKRLYWEQRKTLLKIQQTKEKIKSSCNQLLATRHQNYRQQVINSATDRKYIQSENFFQQDNVVQNNFNRFKQNQPSDYPFGRKVAFINPNNNSYDSDHSSSTYTTSTNMSTPRSMNTPLTPNTVIRMTNYRRVPGSAGDSSIISSNNSSNINMF